MSIFNFLFERRKRLERRHSERALGAGARAKIDSHTYPIADISMGGVKVDKFFSDVALKQRLYLTILLMIEGKVESFPAQAVVRRRGRHEMALQFRRLQPYASHKLEEFVRINSFKPLDFPI